MSKNEKGRSQHAQIQKTKTLLSNCITSILTLLATSFDEIKSDWKEPEPIQSNFGGKLENYHNLSINGGVRLEK